MTRPIEHDVNQNVYKDIVQQSKELQEDLSKLRWLTEVASLFYEGIHERYSELPGWELLHAEVSMALDRPEKLLGSMIPEEEELRWRKDQ